MDPEPLPTSVRLIRGARDRLHRHLRSLCLGVLLIVALVAVFQGFYTVGNGESAALLRCGRLLDDGVQSGLHFRLPGIDAVSKVRTGEVFRLEISGERDPELSLLTSDENLIDAALVVQYRIGRLGDYLFATEAPEALLEQVVRSALVGALAETSVDEVLTAAKASIQNRVRHEAQQRLDTYGSGIVVVAVNLQEVTPPVEAAGAFRAVSDARAEAGQMINEAEGAAERALRLVGGEGGKVVQEAEAAAEARRQMGKGAAERFASLLGAYRATPEQARVELYTATVQKVLPRTRLIVLAPGDAPRLDLNLIERTADEAPRSGLPPGEDHP